MKELINALTLLNNLTEREFEYRAFNGYHYLYLKGTMITVGDTKPELTEKIYAIFNAICALG